MVDWTGKIDDLRVGDIVRLGKSNRLIRAKTPRFTNHGKSKAGHYFYFAIKRPSWTGKCWTMYNTYDLKQPFGGLIKRNCELVHNLLDLRVQQEIFRVAYVKSYRDWPGQQMIGADEMAGVVL